MSSGIFVAANEDWLTGQLFDWMDATWWKDFKGWFGFSPAAPETTTAAPGGETTTAAPAAEPESSKYKPNCVYAYTSKDAKSGYIRSMCVDDKNAQKLWPLGGATDPRVSSLRVGKEVKVNLIPFEHTRTSWKINGQDVNKVVSMDTVLDPAKDEFRAVSASYKFYDMNGNLKHVGDAHDEKSIYLYADENGHAFIGDLKTKSSGDVSKSDAIVKNTSSIRIGKNVEAFLSDGKTSQRIRGQGTKNVINISKVNLNDKVVEVRARRV
jgi:hypothetical protein